MGIREGWKASALAILFAAMGLAARAEQPVSLAAAPPKGDTNWLDDAKHPVEWFKWGADQRLRWEHLQNPFLTDADPPGHVWSFLRNRTRLWGTISPTKDIDINGRLSWEWRYWFTPESRDEWDWGDVVPDQLNVRAKLGDLPATLTVGRQDIILGDGWLVLEGTPLDGSTTIYFDAARLSVDLKDCKTSVDGIFIYQFSDPDEWIGNINSLGRPQIEQDELGLILWVANKSVKNTEIDGYFIYKNSDRVLANGDDGDVYVPGARIVSKFNENWSGRIEGAYEFGNKNDRDLSAWGSTGRLNYDFNDQMKNQLHVGAEFLSGDSPGNSQNEQFDPLWARWPQFSELYVYTYANETRIAETTNLFRLNAGWSAQPVAKLTTRLDYHALFAPENPKDGSPGFNSSGSFRGHLFTGFVGYKFDQHLAAHLVGEVLLPGDYYDETDGIPAMDSRRDFASYFRIEVMLTL